ncbi:autorepressor SdpR family transcription factor [Fodinisporobacter ferrooxydans]|uniref:Autorepressor SdpR family transcription factor n=1 Tax=Fodinisporobacter ferrooxydans TaxID=2901836 RepID=A0ABY4CS87_9BACL|nr:autorepressor SdpR family transcription factor [Alicyclobacillaceae bacterium MYW30-H2]
MFDESFKALADPTRRQILLMLRDRDMTAGEIAGCFSISKPSLTHHLNLLKQANMVIDTREGQFIRYSLNTTVMQDLIGWMMGKWQKGDTNDEQK